MSRDLLGMVCGERLGNGMSREVYVYRPDPTLVIKIETGGWHQNVQESTVWDRVKFVDGISEWFAPVVQLSAYGQILLQKRTEPATVFPDKIPAFLTDCKPGNFGMLNGKFVAHDYANHLLMEKGMTKRMRTMKWANRFGDCT